MADFQDYGPSTELLTSSPSFQDYGPSTELLTSSPRFQDYGPSTQLLMSVPSASSHAPASIASFIQQNPGTLLFVGAVLVLAVAAGRRR